MITLAEAKKQASGAVHARLREMVASGRSVTEIAEALTGGNIGRVATLMGAAFAKAPKPEVIQGVWDARAEEVYRRALAIDSKVSIATVYRTVRLLEEKGILERHDFGGGRARYEPTDHGHHYHLIDVDSGKVIEFEDAAHERLVQEIAARLGFSLIGQRLELFGRKPKGEALARQRDTDGEG